MRKNQLVFNSKTFEIEHLDESPENIRLLDGFAVGKNAFGLEIYLKEYAMLDEQNNLSRTYLIKDKSICEIAAYFSLRNGLITQQITSESFDSIPSIELSNFAVNLNYKKNHPEIGKLGAYVFKTFVLPIVQYVSDFSGVNSLYIYALPEPKLIEHYKKLGFNRLSPQDEQFIYDHVKPKYDDGCIFMYQML